MKHKTVNPKLKKKKDHFENNYISQTMRDLAEYLVTQKIINKILIGETSYSGTGAYQPDRNIIGIVSSSPEIGDRLLAHEIVHALAEKPTRIDKIINIAKKEVPKHFKYIQDVVLPKHWSEGKANDLYSSADRFGKIGEAIQDAGQKRLEEVRSKIPEGENWSGLLPLSKGFQIHSHGYEEATAYSYTDPRLAKDMLEQEEKAKQFGMYLLNHDIPMEIVEPLVKHLAKLKRGSEVIGYSSGGSASSMIMQWINKNETTEESSK